MVGASVSCHDPCLYNASVWSSNNIVSHLVHRFVQDDSTADGNSDLVIHKGGEGYFVLVRPFMQEWAVLKEFGGELFERKAGQGWVPLANKVFIVPVSLLNLEKDALDRLQFFLR